MATKKHGAPASDLVRQQDVPVKRRKRGGRGNKAANYAALKKARDEVRLGPLSARNPSTGRIYVAPGPRPVEYDEKIGRQICAMFATDTKMTLGRLDNDPTLPTCLTFYEWLREHPELDKTYTRSRDLQLERQAEELAEIAATPLIGVTKVSKSGTDPKGGEFASEEVRESDNVERAKLIIETRKWLLSKQRPKKYGIAPDGAGNGPNEQLQALFDALKTEA